MSATRGDYAEVNGLRMYYETRGTSRPLVVLHGAYMTVEAMGGLVLDLAETRRVISVELQGRGRTADVADRPIDNEGMAVGGWRAVRRVLDVADPARGGAWQGRGATGEVWKS
jgi:pimeloyl-ACP methyl ester carboxylesterase